MVLENYRAGIRQSPYGKAPIGDLLRALNEGPAGPELQLIFQVLALRKDEALPVVKERLRQGGMYEKHMLTKLLRLCPWPETRSELLALASDQTEPWLPRQGALYALGALGDESVGPQIAAILTDENSPQGVVLVAIAAMARIGYRASADAIRPFVEDQDIHLRLFAWRALAELGEPVNLEFLFSALRNDEYLIRQEACGALAAAQGADIAAKLQLLAKNDPHEAVRDAAGQALLEREIRGRSPAEKLALLSHSLPGAERHNALWILRAILAQCDSEGRAFVGKLAAADSRLRERSLTYLLFSERNPR